MFFSGPLSFLNKDSPQQGFASTRIRLNKIRLNKDSPQQGFASTGIRLNRDTPQPDQPICDPERN
jgi:hypothetical protein